MDRHFDIGCLVKSKQGRDKGELYIVVEIQGDRLFLVNGKTKLFTSPKKKNIKHLEYVCHNDVIQEKLKNKIKIFDAEIYSNIKKFSENI